MRTPWTLLCLSVLVAAGTPGCASAPSGGEAPSPSETYTGALAALEAGDHALGQAELIRVLEYCGTSTLGERVAIALMTDALDPLHPDPDFAAELSHAYLSQPYRTPWAEQVANSTYLVALNLGGSYDGEDPIFPSADPSELPDECRQDPFTPTWREPAAIPELSEQSISGRLAELERSVEELQEELGRVRETLRP